MAKDEPKMDPEYLQRCERLKSSSDNINEYICHLYAGPHGRELPDTPWC